jgi:RND family efflux transporter MFP subunit
VGEGLRGRGTYTQAMMFASRTVWSAAGAAALGLSGALGSAGNGRQPDESSRPASEVAASFAGIKAIARPSRDSTMGFTFPAEIAEVLVRGGAVVRKGDVLVRANDLEARAQRDLAQVVAGSDLEVRRARVAVEQAQVEFEAQEALRKGGGGSQVDYDRARTLLEARRVDEAISELNRVQQRLNLDLRQAQLDRFTLRAPFDGRVDHVLTDVGEVKRDSDPVVRVVDTDPLWIDAFTPTLETLTRHLRPGDRAWVLLDLPGPARVYVGQVVELAAEADASASERRVRVELPNPEDWPAGLTAWVRFSEPAGEWRSRIVAPGGVAPAGAGVAPAAGTAPTPGARK